MANIHIIHTIVRGQITCFCFRYRIFESPWLVLQCVAAAFRLEKDEFEYT